MDIYSDEVLGIIGESGSGKSTLADVIMGNIRPPLRLVEGKVVFYDSIAGFIELTKQPYKYLRDNIFGKKISIAPQYAMSALPALIKIWKMAQDIYQSHGLTLTPEEVIDKLRGLFESIDLPPDTVEKYPYQLSGGMRQRVVLALSVLLNPDVLITDEIIAALDVVTAKKVLETLKNIKRKGYVKTVVMISHDVPAVLEVADRIAVMYAGKLVEIAPSENLVETAKHPYLQLLLKAIPMLDKSRKKELKWVPGDIPNLANPPPGCRFHPRCPFVMEVCKTREPPVLKLSSKHIVSCWLYARG